MKKPKLADKPAKPEKKPKAAEIAAGGNTMDPQTRAIFLSDKEKYAKAIERQKKAGDAVREIKQTINADGFSVRQIQVAIQLETPEGEAEFRMRMADDLLAAQYAGAAIGSQLQLFLDDRDRTPLADRAFEDGVQAAMAGKQAKPPYDPSTEAFIRFLDGFHSVTENMVKAGIKPISSEMN
jgi:hypothetical protein